jgi:hypothetical protein
MDWIADIGNDKVAPSDVVHVARRPEDTLEARSYKAVVDDGIFE